MNKTNKKTVVIFGVFDKLHDGHRFLVAEAKKYGDVTAVVARDMAVLRLKGHFTMENEEDRIVNIKKLAGDAVLGDEEDSEYKVLKKLSPDIICFGYDQTELKKDIEEKITKGILPKMELVVIDSFKPEIYHSSLLN